MPKKFKECVKAVTISTKKRYGYLKYNPYAVCRVSTGYYGTTHDIGLLKPKRRKTRKARR